MTATASNPEDQAIKQFNAHSVSGDSYAAESITIFQAAVRDHFTEGLKALSKTMYPQAVQRFTDFLTTVHQGPPVTESDEAAVVAHAHLGVAVAMLGGAAIQNKSPQVLKQVEDHLDRARGAGSRADTFNIASVLWAMVKEDSKADGMFPTPPPLEELRPSFDQLSQEDLEFLAKHIRQARGDTFTALQQKAGTHAITAATAPPPMAHHVPSGRPKAVTNYFKKPVGFREYMWMAFAGFGFLLLLTGLGNADVGACLFVVGVIIIVTAFAKTIGCFLGYPKPTDDQMHKWLEADIEHTVKPRALVQLRIDGRSIHEGGDLVVPEQTIVGVAMPGIVWEVTGTLAFWNIKFADDKHLRCTHYWVLVLFMSENIVSAYTALLDSRTGNILRDATQEHRYADIAGVQSSTIPLNVSPEMRKQISQDSLARVSASHEFSLNIVDGRRLTITVGLPTAASGTEGGVAWGNAQSLAMIQRMVRGKKEG